MYLFVNPNTMKLLSSMGTTATVTNLELKLDDYIPLQIILSNNGKSLPLPDGSTITLTAKAKAAGAEPIVLAENFTLCGPHTAAKVRVHTASSSLAGLQIVAGGSGYKSAPTIVFESDSGSGAEAVATISNSGVIRAQVLDGGRGYSGWPSVTASVDGFGVGGNLLAVLDSTGRLASVVVLEGGSGYPKTTTVTFSGGSGSGAKAEAAVANGAVTSVAITDPGAGYSPAPGGTISSTAVGSGAVLRATVNGAGAISGATRLAAGSSYANGARVVTFAGPSGSGGSATFTVASGAFPTTPTSTTPGSAYLGYPTATIGDGTGCSLSPVINTSGALIGVQITSGGVGYPDAPVIAISGGVTGSGASASALIVGGEVISTTITDPGSYYPPPPLVTIGGSNVTASLRAVMSATGTLLEVQVLNGGSGYAVAPSLTISAGGGVTAATATATVSGGQITDVTVVGTGAGYPTAPTALLAAPGGGTACDLRPIIAADGTLVDVKILSPGSLYANAPTVVFDGTTTDAVAALLVVDGAVVGTAVQTEGAGLATPPTVAISGGIHKPAILRPNVDNSGKLVGVTVEDGGEGYPSAPDIVFSGGSGSAAAATATLRSGYVRGVVPTAGGSGYFVEPTVTIKGGGGSGAAARAITEGGKLVEIEVLSGGKDYTSTPTIEVGLPSGGTSGIAVAEMSPYGALNGLTLVTGGSGYFVEPTVIFRGGGGLGAAAVAILRDGKVAEVNVTNPGYGYKSAPEVILAGGGGIGATAVARLSGVKINHLQLKSGGRGYGTYATIAFTNGGASRQATATVGLRPPLAGGGIARIQITDPGFGYTSAPTATFVGFDTTPVVTCQLSPSYCNTLAIGSGGSGYHIESHVEFSGGGGSGATGYVRPVSGSPAQYTKKVTNVYMGPYVSLREGTYQVFAKPEDGPEELVGTVTAYEDRTGGGYDSNYITKYRSYANVPVSKIAAIYERTGKLPGMRLARPGWVAASPGAEPTLEYVTVMTDEPRILVENEMTKAAVPGGYEIVITNNGSGYSSPPTPVFKGKYRPSADNVYTTTLINGGVSSVTAGGAYTPFAEIDAGRATIVLDGKIYYTTVTVNETTGAITGVVFPTFPTFMASAPLDFIPDAGLGGSGATLVPGPVSGRHLTSVTVVYPGTTTEVYPTVVFSGGGGSGATAHCNVRPDLTEAEGGTGGYISTVVLTNAGSGYTSAPDVTIVGGPVGHTPATAEAIIDAGQVVAVDVVSGGSDYLPPTLVIAPPASGTPATGEVIVSNGQIAGVKMNYGGAGYISMPVITVARRQGVNQVDAALEAVIYGDGVLSVKVLHGGSGYAEPPTVLIDGNGSGATATAVVSDGRVIRIVLASVGSGYSTASATLQRAGAVDASITTTVVKGSVAAITVQTPGAGYPVRPSVVFSGGGGTGAEARAIITGGVLTGIQMVNEGSGYTSTPTVTIEGSPADGSGAAAVADFRPSYVSEVVVTNPGADYLPPDVTVSFVGGGGGGGATAVAIVAQDAIAEIKITSPGTGYRSVPTVIIESDTGRGALAKASIEGGRVVSVVVTDAGSGYLTPPTVKVVGDGSGANVVSKLIAYDQNSHSPVLSVEVVDAGRGYVDAPTVTFTGYDETIEQVNAGSAAYSGGFGYYLQARPTTITRIPRTTTVADQATAETALLDGRLAAVTVLKGGDHWPPNTEAVVSPPPYGYAGFIDLTSEALQTALGVSAYADFEGEISIVRPGEEADTKNIQTSTLNFPLRIFNDMNKKLASGNQSVTVVGGTPTPITLSMAGTGAYSVVVDPSHGTLTGTAPNLTYTRTGTYTGVDSFTFKRGTSSTATVSINVT